LLRKEERTAKKMVQEKEFQRLYDSTRLQEKNKMGAPKNLQKFHKYVKLEDSVTKNSDSRR